MPTSYIGQIFPIDVNDILRFIKSLIREWRSIGIGLYLSYDTLEEIAANNPQNVRGCLTTMIIKWMNTSSAAPPCWWLLVKALKSIDQHGAVRKITSKYGM